MVTETMAMQIPLHGYNGMPDVKGQGKWTNKVQDNCSDELW